jgi:hypothetical protein
VPKEWDANSIFVTLSMSIIVVGIVILLLFSPGCVSIVGSYIPDSTLTEGWQENSTLRNHISQTFGLEQLASITYEVQGDYPATLTVSTLKSSVVLNDQQLQEKNDEALAQVIKDGIQLEKSPRVSGERFLLKGHKTHFEVYDGVTTNSSPIEHVRVIAEIWNCQPSGTSVICVGIAYITHTVNQTVFRETKTWTKIVMDNSGTIDYIIGNTGLIDHVVCH